jgi:hypothetical protein
MEDGVSYPQLDPVVNYVRRAPATFNIGSGAEADYASIEDYKKRHKDSWGGFEIVKDNNIDSALYEDE